jgi:hypothetical protein
VRVLPIPDLVTYLYLLTHRDMKRAPRVRAFFDFVQTEIRSFRAVLSGRTARRSDEINPLDTGSRQ